MQGEAKRHAQQAADPEGSNRLAVEKVGADVLNRFVAEGSGER